jgi:hypothetical protein
MLSPLISPSLSNEDPLHHLVISSPVIVALRIAIARVEEWPRGKAPGDNTVTCRSRIALRSLEILSAAETQTDDRQSVTIPEMVVMIKVCNPERPKNQGEPPEYLIG